MMLARVADSLYWMGRYIERAENVTRLLMVTSDFSVELEGLDDSLARREWVAVMAALPGSTPIPPGKAGMTVSHMRSLLLDQDNPMSVFSSLDNARDNARSISEALTREVFTNLNETHRQLRDQRKKGFRTAVQAQDLANEVHEGILTTLGAIEHTLTRDQGWTYLKLGEAMERTQRTVLVMRAQLPELAKLESEIDPTLFYAGWRSLLLSLASLENFRRAHGAGLEPEAVTRFLLFNGSTPRAVRCGVGRMKGYLNSLPKGESGIQSALRVMGRLDAQVTYDDEQVMAEESPLPFLDQSLSRLRESHDFIVRNGVA